MNASVFNLMGYLQNLQIAWKDYFGLSTQYVGYLDPEMALSLMTVQRYSDLFKQKGIELDNDIVQRINQEILDLQDFCPEYKLQCIQNKEEIKAVMPDIIKKIRPMQVSHRDISEEEWEAFSNYVHSKS